MAINPASLMPGASPRTPGAVSIMPDLAQSSSPRSAGLPPESAATAGSRVAAEGGIGFETPAQVTTLQNANKVCHPFFVLFLLLVLGTCYSIFHVG